MKTVSVAHLVMVQRVQIRKGLLGKFINPSCSQPVQYNASNNGQLRKKKLVFILVNSIDCSYRSISRKIYNNMCIFLQNSKAFHSKIMVGICKLFPTCTLSMDTFTLLTGKVIVRLKEEEETK